MKAQLVLSAIALLASAQAENKLEWWQNSIIYQVYPSSFQDTDGDGRGDLKGITSHVRHFQNLKVGAIWLSPIYKSPQKDNGYDISDYESIDKIYGTMDDFKELVKTLNDSKPAIKLIMDFVPNHSSDEHTWFKKSIKKDPKYKDFYIWVEKEKTGPPNNWTSIFGGSAWTYNEERKGYYYHTFGAFQPDLNYSNPAVKDAMKAVLKKWMDYGVFGFRMDAVPFLLEDARLQDEPALPGCHEASWSCQNHTHTKDQKGTYDLLREFRKTLDDYAKDSFDKSARVMMVEAYTEINKTMAYYGTKDAPIAHFPFNFQLQSMNQDSKADDFVNTIKQWINYMPEGMWANWVTGNHDNSRIGTKMGVNMIDGMNMLQLLLPGTAITYYGEEIGMTDTYVRKDQLKDALSYPTRDSERTPFHWNVTLNAGFSTNTTTWLPVNPNYWTVNALNQTKDDKSHLKNYQRLSGLRTIFGTNTTLEIKKITDYTFAFMRLISKDEKYITIINLNNVHDYVNVSKIMDTPKQMYVHTPSLNSPKKQGSSVDMTNLTLTPNECLVIAMSGSGSVAGYAPLLLVALLAVFRWN